ncbi:MAG: hypothetical protein ABI651_03120 [Verrucomicrobiota bacterium]
MELCNCLQGYNPKAGQTDLRGWEWWYYSKLCRGDDIPGSDSGLTSVWDYERDQEVTTLPESGEHSLFSRDGQTLVTGSWKGSVIRIFSLPVFSPDGRTLAAGEPDKVSLWDVATKQIKAKLPSEPNPVGFTSDGSVLITASVPTPLPIYPGVISGMQFWDVGSAALKRTLNFSSTNETASAATLSPDGATLATGDLGTNVFLWDTRTGLIRERLTSVTRRIWNLVFSRDGKMLAVGAWGSLLEDRGQIDRRDKL